MKSILYYLAYMIGLIGHSMAIILILAIEGIEILIPMFFLLTAGLSFIMLSFYLYWQLNGDFDPNI